MFSECDIALKEESLQLRFQSGEMLPCCFQVASQLLLGSQTEMYGGEYEIDIPGCHPHPLCDPGGIVSFLTQETDRNPPGINGLLELPLAKDLTWSQIHSLCNRIDD